MKKLISISLPCRNEEDNIEEMVEKISEQFEKELPEYDYQIQFSDNCSTDRTRDILRNVCKKNHRVRAIFNVASFTGSAFNSIFQTDGDCCIHMASDFQDPPETIPIMVREWEKGYKVVCAIKSSSKENKLMWWIRSIYYKIMHKFSDIEQIRHFNGFGLYDREFIKIMQSLNDPIPTLRGIVAEYGYKRKDIFYTQNKRQRGKSSNNFYRLFEYSMRNFTTYTKFGIHFVTILGISISILSLLAAIVFFVIKLTDWYRYPAGMIPAILGIFFIGSMQLFFIGLIGEYIININTRVINRPLVVEEEKINFPKD